MTMKHKRINIYAGVWEIPRLLQKGVLMDYNARDLITKKGGGAGEAAAVQGPVPQPVNGNMP